MKVIVFIVPKEGLTSIYVFNVFSSVEFNVTIQRLSIGNCWWPCSLAAPVMAGWVYG